MSRKASVKERAAVAHVLRRLSMGPQPDLAATLEDSDAAIARALDLSAPAATPPAIAPPPDYEAAQAPGALEQPITFWLQQMQSSPRLIEERLVWFWHDHFATSVAKVRIPYLMWQQHLLLRKHATGNFAELLHAVSKDPAMLWFLDGVTNTARAVNENFGREVMELFTIGRGNYTEQDVVEASRAFTGWAVNILGLPQLAALSAVVPPWNATFLAARHDNGTKTLLGTTANLDLDGALDVLLNHEATATRIAGKLYTELVGVAPSEKTAKRLGKTFRDQNYAVMPLVEAIVAEPAFTSEQRDRGEDAFADRETRGHRAGDPARRISTSAGWVDGSSTAARVASPTRSARSATYRSCRPTSRATRRACASSDRTSWCTRSTCCRCTRARR